MTLWQGVYAYARVVADATNVVNGSILQVPGLTSPGVLNSSGAALVNGGSVSDDRLMAGGVVVADAVTFASGVVFADGRITADTTGFTDILLKAKVVVLGD